MIDATRRLSSSLAFAPWFSHASSEGARLTVHVTRCPTPRERADVPSSFEGLPVSIAYLPPSRPDPAT
jgi:hypothetical protein